MAQQTVEKGTDIQVGETNHNKTCHYAGYTSAHRLDHADNQDDSHDHLHRRQMRYKHHTRLKVFVMKYNIDTGNDRKTAKAASSSVKRSFGECFLLAG